MEEELSCKCLELGASLSSLPGFTESSVASRLVNSKEPGAMVQLAVTHDSLGQVAEEEGKRGEDEEDEEKEEEKEEEEDWEEDWEDKAVQHVGLPPAQNVSSAQLGRKRRSPSDGVPANSRRRLFLPDLSECEDSDSEEDQYQHLHQSWNLTQEDEIKRITLDTLNTYTSSSYMEDHTHTKTHTHMCMHVCILYAASGDAWRGVLLSCSTT